MGRKSRNELMNGLNGHLEEIEQASNHKYFNQNMSQQPRTISTYNFALF